MTAGLSLTPSLPVLILQQSAGRFQHGVLGIARSLGRLGVPVHVLHHDPRSPAAMSRFLRGSVVPTPRDAATGVVLDRLRRFADEHGPAVLIPTDDDSALLVEANASWLRACYRFPEQPAGLAAALSDKWRLSRLCLEYDVPTPWTAVPQGRAELVALARELAFPVMVKGIDGGRLFRRTGERMRIVRDAGELLRTYDALEDPEEPNLMVQEYIPGGPESVWMLNGYFDAESQCHVPASGRKLRQFPRHTGVTTLGVCVPNPEVEETTKRFMKALGYRGVLDLGYRYDARDGRYKLLDVNPRVGATFRLFARGELDVVRALYLDLTGQPVPPAPPCRPGRKWLVENFDAASSVRARRAGELTVRRWAAALRGVEELAWYAPDDPRPFLRMLRCSTERALARRWSAAAGAAATVASP